MSREDPPPLSDAFDRHSDTTRPLFALGRSLTDRTLLVATAAVVTVCWRLANLVPPYLLGVGIDAFVGPADEDLAVALLPQSVVPEERAGQYLLLVGLFGTVVVTRVVADVARHLSWRWLQQSVLHDLRVAAYDAVQRLDLAVFETERTGDVMSVLNNDVNRLQTFLNDGAQQILQTASFFLVTLAIMLGLHWQLTLVLVGFVPVMLGLVYGYKRLIEPWYDDRRAAVGRLNAHLQTVVGGIQTVKASTNESQERERLATNSRRFWRADWNAAKLTAVFFPGRELVSSLVMLTTITVGGWWVVVGPPLIFTRPLSPGTFVTFYFFGQMFVSQSSRLGDITDTYTDAAASAKRVFGLLDYPVSVTDDPDAVTLDDVRGEIVFDGVTFIYPGESEPAVEDVTVDIDANDYVGLVGPTGAGKSTLLKLLLRFYEPEAGRISLDGIDVSEITLDSLRGAVGYVGQDATIMSATVRENVAYGHDEAVSDEAVRRAAERANAHRFVTELEDGYETEVGERGTRLSGGQRQRIAIARAILSDPDVLLLYEATSHVDNRTELLIQEGLSELTADRTTVAVAHRLSTIRDADEIVVFDDGRIVERGDHETLVKRDGLYAELWQVHTGERTSVPELASTPGGTSRE
ncbi:ABC transporter ATP-binding protein [Halobaculum sp. MBLA0147]|uniref:ABC transporter ATP-binding protein n=1 Tax=Halobaculum sp. MBLA0147 TaxID=3079934 RepID=UPI0035233A3E